MTLTTITRCNKALVKKMRENAHLPISELAYLLGITNRSVSRIAYRHKIKLNARRGKPWKPRQAVRERKPQVVKRPEERIPRPETVRQKEQAKSLVSQGLDMLEISKVLGFSYDQTRHRLKYWGIEAKSKGYGPRKSKGKIKPLNACKVKVAQVVEKEKIIQPVKRKGLKIEKEDRECKVRDFTGMKLVSLGVNRMSFYVPSSFTFEQVEAEKLKRLQKYKSA